MNLTNKSIRIFWVLNLSVLIIGLLSGLLYIYTFYFIEKELIYLNISFTLGLFFLSLFLVFISFIKDFLKGFHNFWKERKTYEIQFISRDERIIDVKIKQIYIDILFFNLLFSPLLLIQIFIIKTWFLLSSSISLIWSICLIYLTVTVFYSAVFLIKIMINTIITYVYEERKEILIKEMEKKKKNRNTIEIQ